MSRQLVIIGLRNLKSLIASGDRLAKRSRNRYSKARWNAWTATIEDEIVLFERPEVRQGKLHELSGRIK